MDKQTNIPGPINLFLYVNNFPFVSLLQFTLYYGSKFRSNFRVEARPPHRPTDQPTRRLLEATTRSLKKENKNFDSDQEIKIQHITPKTVC